MKWILFILLIFICTYGFAKDISAPPPLKDEPVAEQHYLKALYNNWNKLEKTNTNPNGNRIGKIGDTVLYETPLLEYYFAVNINGAYHWWAVKLDSLL